MKSNRTMLLAILSFSFLFAKSALAVCPVCTLAVVGGLEISQQLGVDDMVTSLWIGAIIVSMIMWTINWFNKKNIRFKGRKIIITVGYYALVIVPLYWMHNSNGVAMIGGDPKNAFMGVDKVLLGVIIGSILFFLSNLWYENMKKKNNGRGYFPFQKVVMPLASLIIASAFFYLLTK